jgi:hypothetical protein
MHELDHGRVRLDVESGKASVTASPIGEAVTDALRVT